MLPYYRLYISDFYVLYTYIFYDMVKFYLINNSPNYNVPKLYIFPFKFLTLYIFYFKLIKNAIYKGKKIDKKNK
jgi:hypothetical protein